MIETDAWSFFMAVTCKFFILFDAWYEWADVAVAKTHVDLLDMEPIRVHIKFTMNRVEPKRVHQFCTMNL